MDLYLLMLLFDVLLCLCIGLIAYRKKNIVYPLIMGGCLFFCSNVIGDMALFFIDRFTLFRGICSAVAIDILLLAVLMVFAHPKTVRLKDIRSFFNIEPDIRKFLIPLLVSLLVIPFVSNKNELFGMGQDEGVYQTVAVNYINGRTARQQDFEEYHLLETEEQRANFREFVHGRIVGYDVPAESYPDTVYDRNVSDVSGIYHGIPTYAALLAMWGRVFGLEDMLGIQTVFLILMLFLVSFICQNLKLRKTSEFAAVITTAFAPTVVWVAKSSLTEMFTGVLICMFIYFMTDNEQKQQAVFSIVPIAAFACFHVSIYTMVPFFIAVYGGMYFFTKRSIYAVYMPLTAIGYVISFFVMRQTQPFYTMNNYSPLFSDRLNVANLPQAVLAIGAVLAVVSAAFALAVKKFIGTDNYSRFISVRKNAVIMRVFLSILLILPILVIVKNAFSYCEDDDDFGHLAIVGFAANVGVVLFIAGILLAFVFTEKLYRDERRLVIFLAFFYCVLVYVAFMRGDIKYYYYYSRYLVPFIPVAAVFAVTVLDRIKFEPVLVAAAVGLVYTLPYDNILRSEKDDTRVEWETLNDVVQYISSDDCILVDGYSASRLWLPVRAMTGAHVYPFEADIDKQCRKLSQKYNEVYFLSHSSYTYDESTDFEIVYMDNINAQEDKGKSDFDIVPFAKRFDTSDCDIHLYRYIAPKTFYDAFDIYHWQTSGYDRVESVFCWTLDEESGTRCVLEKNDYKLTVDLALEIPLEKIKTDDFEVRLMINGEYVDTETIDSSNNGGELVFDIPEECVEDGTNIIRFVTPVWEAAVVSPEDDRELGIPVASLNFEYAD